MSVPLLDLTAQYRAIQTEIDEAVGQVLASGNFILGPNVKALEAEIARYLDVKHAVGLNSGTDALLLALHGLGIGPGDEVIVPTYTFFATAETVMLVGATPVFVDVEPETYALDVRQVEQRITPRTKAVIPVHLFGHPADMTALREVVRGRDIRLIEDNAQAIGAEWQGRRTGGIGDAGCLSFYPSKNLGAYGDGGMLVTNDDALADRVRMLRTHGWKKKYFSEIIGYNSRLDELQAAILRVKLRHLEEWNEQRRELAAEYARRFKDVPIGLPREVAGAKHVYHLYVVSTPTRDELAQQLEAAGIASGVYYPQPIHTMAPCAALGYREGDFPVSEQACRETLAIPLYPGLSDAQIDQVVTGVEHAVTRSEVRV